LKVISFTVRATREQARRWARRRKHGILLSMGKNPKKRPRKPKDDFTQVAFRVFKQAIGEAPPTPQKKLPPKAAAGQKGGLKGGRARADRLSPEERSRIAKRAAEARWRKPPR
jgi:hypothetical protein